ncbi:MAG: NUMOD4 domain-containing protein [Xenococcus sp. MO_188.B8]|nr:NUMOD4 domain-containing protein [Xenococcus sp. MO_188.B8]
MSKEVYKLIPGFPNYEVSNLGNVRNKKIGKVLKLYHSNNGYLTVGFTISGKKKRLLIHRLVAKTFLDNPTCSPEVNHIDGNRLNNALTNLEWISSSNNRIHAYKSGLRKSKLTANQVKEIRQLIELGLTQRKIAAIFNVSHSTIGEINRKEIWSHI